MMDRRHHRHCSRCLRRWVLSVQDLITENAHPPCESFLLAFGKYRVIAYGRNQRTDIVGLDRRHTAGRSIEELIVWVFR